MHKHSLIRIQKWTLTSCTLTKILSKVVLHVKMQKNHKVISQLSAALTIVELKCAKLLWSLIDAFFHCKITSSHLNILQDSVWDIFLELEYEGWRQPIEPKYIQIRRQLVTEQCRSVMWAPATCCGSIVIKQRWGKTNHKRIKTVQSGELKTRL